MYAAAVFMKPHQLIIHTCTTNPRSFRRICGHRFKFFPGKPFSSVNRRILGPTGMGETVRVKAGVGDGAVGAITSQGFTHDGSTSFATKGLESTLNNLSKWIAAISFTLFLLLRHDAEALWAATGSVINASLASTLKKIINQERPLSHLRSDPGMPSSHAQSLFYIVTFFNLSLMQWLGWNGSTACLIGLVFAAASYFVWLRVSQGFHTVPQVLVGAILGISFSVLWSVSWDSIVRRAFMSHLWVRALVTMGGVIFYVSFIAYILNQLLGKALQKITNANLIFALFCLITMYS